MVAVIPARNEEAVVGRAIASLLDQDYPGPLHIILVDDHSTDATIAAAGTHERLSIVEAGPLPKGWTGKLWAVSEGLKRAAELEPGLHFVYRCGHRSFAVTILRVWWRARKPGIWIWSPTW